ncbi:MAG: NAD-dependent epimerase/dehydratase family protein [Deltaproteobacteria bacterium]|nr:MAG: NAD-dependent epimerase/dehydratase family protein [Deltaproteobacteria bacterium]
MPATRSTRPDRAVVLVTGGTGFLGRHVVAELRAQSMRTRVLMRSDLNLALPCDERAVGELGDDDAIARAVDGVRAIVHCAGRVAGPGTTAEYFRDNVAGTERLLAAAGSAGVERFVHVSSTGIYGLPSGSRAVTEDTSLDSDPPARGAYTWSKLESDRRVQEFSRATGLSTVTLRIGILVGPGGPEFIARLCYGRLGGRVVVIGRRDTELPLCHVEDAARAVVLAVVTPGASGPYNLVAESVTQEEWLIERERQGNAVRVLFFPPRLAEAIAVGLAAAAQVTGRPAPRLSPHFVRRKTESMQYDTTRARRELGWTPRIGFRAPIEARSPVVEVARLFALLFSNLAAALLM